MRAILLMLVLLVPGMAQALESAPVTSPRATVTLVSDSDAVPAGGSYRVGLRLRMAPGWHTYWRNPGDAGVPAEFEFSLPPGVTAGPIDWPTPMRQAEEGLTTYGYTGELLLPATITGGPGKLSVSAHWLICEKICVPEEGTFSLDIPAGPARPSAEAALFRTAEARRPAPGPWRALVASDGTLALEGPGLSAVTDAWFMPLEPDRIAASAAQPLTVGDSRLTLALKPAANFAPQTALSGVLVLRDRGGQETAFALTAEPGTAEPALPLWQALGLAVLGGLILNLMPCVFPVLAMKAMALTRLSGQAQRHARQHAAAYAGGVIATFLAIAVVMLGLRHAGSLSGWGFQFQSPVFVVAMAVVLFAIGLNLSGVYAMGRPVGTGQSLAGREGHAGSVFAGALAVLVATPCTAPFMGAAVTAGLAGSAAVTFAVFAALGVGLAAPYVLLACLPAVAHALPRPGAWMEVFKQFLAFPMYAAAAWLVWVLSLEAGPPGVVAGFFAIGLVAFGLWVVGVLQRGHGRGAGRFIGAGAAGLAFAAGLASAGALAWMPAAEMPADAGSEAFSDSRLATLRAAGKPVFVNVTAAWCVVCLVNERVALAPVRQEFSAHGVVLLTADWTRPVPEITRFLRANGHDGVPLYVFYPAGGQKPVVLPQLLTPGLLEAALRGAA